MKNRIAKSALFLGLFLVFSFSTFAATLWPAFGPGAASAADGSNFAIYLGLTGDQKAEIGKTWADDGDDYDEPGWKLIEIYAKSLFGQNKVTLAFHKDYSHDTATNGASTQEREPVFTAKYYCSMGDHKLSSSAPSSNKYYEIEYAIALNGRSPNADDQNIVNQDTIRGWGGVIKTAVYNPDDGKGDPYTSYDFTNGKFDPTNFFNHRDEGGSDNDTYNDWGIDDADQACRPSPNVVGQMQIANYSKLNPADRNKFPNPGSGSNGSSTGGGSGSGEEVDIGCNYSINPLTWVVCPVIDGFEAMINGLDNVITSQLSVGSPGNSSNPNQIFCDRNSRDLDQCVAYHDAWKSFRNIALGVLLIVGMAVIISEMAGFEFFSAYTLKKMLPRIVAVAIALTLSWQLMDFFVQLSNALGYGVRYLIYQPFISAGFEQATISGGGATAIGFLGVITGGALGIFGLLSFAATGALAVLVAFLTLMIRELVIISLVIIAPVAIILYVMPNTERWYKMWWETFAKALMMFPMIAALIAAGRVFAAVATNGAPNDPFRQILGFAAYFAPYFMIPMTFRFAGTAMAAIGGAINQRTAGMQQGLQKYRAGKRAENWEKTKNFERFSDRTPIGRGLNTAAGALSRPRALMRGKSGIRAQRLTSQMAMGAEALKNDAVHQQHQGDDNYLVALANRELAQHKLDQAREKLVDAEQRGDISAANAARADIDARQNGLDLASQVASRNSAGTKLQAISALSQTGYQWSPGEQGYTELYDSVSKAVGSDNKGAIASAMNTNQFHLKNAGRSDLGGINHGAGVDIKTGIRKLGNYQRGQSKVDAYHGAAQAWLGKEAVGKDGKTANTSAELARGIAASVSSGSTTFDDLAEYHSMLLSDLPSASDANKREISKQIEAIEGYAAPTGDVKADNMDTMEAKARELTPLAQALAKNRAQLTRASIDPSEIEKM